MSRDDTNEVAVRRRRSVSHPILGPCTGYADTEAHARAEIAPARLHEAAGAGYEEFSNVTAPVPASAAASLPLTQGTAGTRWIDGLTATTADILAQYDHPHFRKWPAVTSRVHGAGRITTVGTVPGPELARSLFSWAAKLAGTDDTWRPEHPRLARPI